MDASADRSEDEFGYRNEDTAYALVTDPEDLLAI